MRRTETKAACQTQIQEIEKRVMEGETHGSDFTRSSSPVARQCHLAPAGACFHHADPRLERCRVIRLEVLNTDAKRVKRH